MCAHVVYHTSATSHGPALGRHTCDATVDISARRDDTQRRRTHLVGRRGDELWRAHARRRARRREAARLRRGAARRASRDLARGRAAAVGLTVRRAKIAVAISCQCVRQVARSRRKRSTNAKEHMSAKRLTIVRLLRRTRYRHRTNTAEVSWLSYRLRRRRRRASCR
jgi:hypothetical protein